MFLEVEIVILVFEEIFGKFQNNAILFALKIANFAVCQFDLWGGGVEYFGLSEKHFLICVHTQSVLTWVAWSGPPGNVPEVATDYFTFDILVEQLSAKQLMEDVAPSETFNIPNEV